MPMNWLGQRPKNNVLHTTFLTIQLFEITHQKNLVEITIIHGGLFCLFFGFGDQKM